MRKTRLTVKSTVQFKRDYKLAIKRGCDIERLEDVVFRLSWGTLPSNNRDHALTGTWKGHRECHVLPDWILIYRIDGDTLTLTRTGSHADLFGK